MITDRQREINERRVKVALQNLFDSGNALPDAWNDLMLAEDGYEFQLALMGVPEIAEVDDGGDKVLVLKDMRYYWDELKKLYIDRALQELDAEEAHHGNRRQ